jgi:8-oxo-dGTP pyrophosphatase MutT (NUDIX family)
MKPEISVAEAKQDKLQYVVANFVVVDRVNKTALLLQRGPSEKVHPGKWAFPGGKLEHKNIAEMIEQEEVDPLEGVNNILGKLAVRETKEEAGLSVSGEDNVIIKNKVFIRPDGVPVFMVTLMTEYEGGEVKLEEGFVASAWVSEDELPKYECIPGVQDEARKALSLI